MLRRPAAAAALLLLAALLTACTGTPKPAPSASSSSPASSPPAVSSAVSSSPVSSAPAYPVPEDDPRYVKAYGYYADKKYDAAIAASDDALKSDPGCFWAYNIKGTAYYFANGNSVAQQSLDLLDKALQLDPEYSYAYFNKALILKGLKRYDESVACFQKVLDLKPDDTWSYYGIATCYADQNQADPALQYLKQAMVLDPAGVKDAIQDDMQRHFSRLKSDPRFQALIAS